MGQDVIHLNAGWTWGRSLLANNCLMWLMTLHEDNTRILRPQPDDNRVAPMSPWEAHKRDRLIQGRLPDIQKHVKAHCVGYETSRIHDVEKQAAHAEKKERQEEKERKEERRG